MKIHLNNLKSILLKTVLPSGVLTIVTLLAVHPVACKLPQDTLEILEGDFSIPQMESFSVISESKLAVNFSKEVTVENAVLSVSGGDFYSAVVPEFLEGRLIFNFERNTAIGADYVLDTVVRDTAGNSLTLSISFTGYNSNPAGVVLSEVRNAYGTFTVTSDGEKLTSHKSEFVELYVTKGGSLSGLEIYSVNDGESKCFSLPAIDVEEGEYILCHMRTIAAEGYDGEGMITETGSDLTLSVHTDSCNTARDLWSPNLKACFADSDIILIRDRSGKIYDALVYAKSGHTEWSEEEKETLEKLEELKLWTSSPLCSDYITGTAVTRSMSRNQPLYAGSENWCITCDSGSGSKKIIGVTPGYQNSTNIYIPKE